MPIGQILNKLFSKNGKQDEYVWESNVEGLIYSVSPAITKRINNGDANLLVTYQNVALRMLVEQEQAEAIPNGFIVPTDAAVNLDKGSQQLLRFPPQWSGRIEAEIQSTTGRSDFSISLAIQTQNNTYTRAYSVVGPILRITKQQQYILSPSQQVIFGATNTHTKSEKTEYDNLLALLSLQKAQKAGADISLTHFDNDNLDIKAPESVSISAETDDNGNLILTPTMGQGASTEQVQRVLGQLKAKHATTLRVGSEIILFDEKRLKAVHEILKNRIVPKNKVKDFLKNPTAFIDASLVDLEVGFSHRVHGATAFKHAYFGETDESKIDWLGASTSTSTIHPISKISSSIESEEDLELFKTQVEDAFKTGATEFSFKGTSYDISNPEAVASAIAKGKKIVSGEIDSDDGECDAGIAPVPPEPNRIVVDIDLHDDVLATPSKILQKSIEEVLYPTNLLDWSNYSRTPYPHQLAGIRWILGLALAEEKYEGALLADDMGLGKTLMALSAVDQLYKVAKKTESTLKPCLVVAPLSLLQNWKEEVEKTFSSSPFDDIILLQSNADLKCFRETNIVPNEYDSENNSIAEIRYTLKTGSRYGHDRLDMPERLVITTYQTLRDHQFSLCLVDWGMIIFDEAQNIKNPNTIQTRAAKGLKSDFTLLATGTPVENSLVDFWCLMDTACPGHLGTYQDFRKTYITPILQAAGDEVHTVRGSVGRNLREKVGTLMLRRTKEDNLDSLPLKKIFVGIESPDWEYRQSLKKIMDGQQRDIYDATITAQKESEENMVLSALQRLRDVSLHPQLADGGILNDPAGNNKRQSLLVESGKIQSLLTTLNEVKSREERCIIFIVNKRLQAFLSVALAKHYGLPAPLSVINGDVKAVAKRKSVPTRLSMIKEFEDRDGFNIIIMSPVAAGVGLTVVGANNVIHLERHWNPAKEAQATDRVYRIGQEKNVNVYIPILHHPKFESFDVNLHHLLTKKTLLKDAVVTTEQVIPNPGGFGDSVLEPEHRIAANDLRRVSWRQFEALCAELLAKEFCVSSCWLTQNGSDHGADIVLTTKEMGELVQCKHTKLASYKGYKVIHEIDSARKVYERALGKKIDSLIFATNAKQIPSSTKELAKEYHVQIVSYDEIVSLLEKHIVSFEMIIKRLEKERYKIG